MRLIRTFRFILRIKYFRRRIKIFKSAFNSFSLVKEKIFYSNFTHKNKKIIQITQKTALPVKIYKHVKNLTETSELFLYDLIFLSEKKLFNLSLNLINKKTFVDLLETIILLKKKKISNYTNFSERKSSKKFLSTSYSIYKDKWIEKEKNSSKCKYSLRKIRKYIFSYIKIETNFFLYFRKLMIQKNDKIVIFLLKAFKKRS